MLGTARRAALAGLAALAYAHGAPEPSIAETRPSAATLIAAAKKVPLAQFQVMEEIRDITVEPWLRRLFGANAGIAWRSGSCRAGTDDRATVNSPICVEATIRFKHGVAFVLGIGFDEKAARPQDHANALWGNITVRGRHCDLLRHPDHIQHAPEAINAMIKAGGRCQ